MPDGLVTAVRQIARAETIAGLRLTSESIRAMDALAASGVPALLMKGVALSALTTGSPASRGAGDIDLLVRPENLEQAHQALSDAGWAGEDLVAPGAWRRWYLTMRRERTYLSRQSSIDLHWRAGAHMRPLPTTDVLFARAGSVVVADREVPTLGPEDTLSLAAYHIAIDRYSRLRQFVDVARLVDRPNAGVAADADWRLRRVIAEAVALTDELLGPLGDAVGALRANYVDRAWLLDRWGRGSVRPVELTDADSLWAVVQMYLESAHYAGAVGAMAVAATNAVVPPEQVGGKGVGGFAAAVGRKSSSLIRRRILRNEPVAMP